MNPDLNEYIESLKLRRSKERLNLIGKLLVDDRYLSLWEQDTERLPRGARKWRTRARDFAQKQIRPLAQDADRDPYTFDPQPLIKESFQQGFQSLLLIPPLGRAAVLPYFRSIGLQIVVVAEEFATECGGLALLLLAHNLGIAPLMLSGSLSAIIRHLAWPYMKSAWLGHPDYMAFAITEPDAGSDVECCEGASRARLNATARPVQGGYILNGTKVFISGGMIADRIAFYARLEGESIESWTCFLLHRNMKGLSVGRREKKMGQRACDASEIIADDVFVPRRNVIGRLRSGWANNHNVLNYSRPAVGAMALGHGRGAFERALQFCRTHELGSRPLIEHKDVQFQLADMTISLWAIRSLIWHCCSNLRASQAISSAVKVFASDTAYRVTTQAMELLGDEGCLHDNGVERSWRDARLTQIYEGTNQINRYDIIEHQWETDFAPQTGTDKGK